MPTLTPTTLVTERLRLRWLDEHDAAGLFAIFSDPEVTRYWSSGPWTTIDQARESLRATLADYASGAGLRFGIELLDGGALVGTASLHHFVDASRRCDIGYALASRYWGQGHAGAALRALVDYAFATLDLNRIEADIDPRNGASARVVERLGFQREGFMPERWIVNGEPADTVNYGLLRRYWPA